jgi:GNAT superfamily N-acetyltransferase
MISFTFQEISPNDHELISLISKWYCDEWNIAPEITSDRFTQFSEDDIIFHLILKDGDVPIASGGLHWKVGLLKVHPEFKAAEPWVGLVYTVAEKRNQGIATLVMKEIEEHSLKLGFKKILLFTNTAESLYKKLGWSVTHRLIYKGKDTVVMEKEF